MRFVASSQIISPSLSPNTEWDDVLLALKMILKPWRCQKGSAIPRVEQWFRRYFPDREVALFNSGRSALLAILKAFGIGVGDEVLVQAFTCVAVPNSVFWAGAKPVYVDIDETFNIDPAAAEGKITKKTKAIIVQHTFGVPAQLDKLSQMTKKHNLIMIEDCAHSLGATYKGKKNGTFGEAAFFSFGRDKVISSVFGGAAIIASNFKPEVARLKHYQKSLLFPTYFWIFQQLLHPIAFSLILASYNFPPLLRRFDRRKTAVHLTFGKALLYVLQRLKLLSKPVYPVELQGLRPAEFPARYPNALAGLLLKQLGKLERFNWQRQEVAGVYRQALGWQVSVKMAPDRSGSIYLRFPLLVEAPGKLHQIAKESGILLGNWYHHVVDPAGVDFNSIGYQPGSCPKAEAVSRKIINLPTRIKLAQAKRILSLFKK